jgi:hypothetical protein
LTRHRLGSLRLDAIMNALCFGCKCELFVQLLILAHHILDPSWITEVTVCVSVWRGEGECVERG